MEYTYSNLINIKIKCYLNEINFFSYFCLTSTHTVSERLEIHRHRNFFISKYHINILVTVDNLFVFVRVERIY